MEKLNFPLLTEEYAMWYWPNFQPKHVCIICA